MNTASSNEQNTHELTYMHRKSVKSNKNQRKTLATNISFTFFEIEHRASYNLKMNIPFVIISIFLLCIHNAYFYIDLILQYNKGLVNFSSKDTLKVCIALVSLPFPIILYF